MQRPAKSKQPVAVLLSDVHYDLNTLELADKATRMAVEKSNDLKVRLIVCGDLHNSKANLRGECVKAMIETFSLCQMQPIILRGNHDSLNERSEEHALEFLGAYSQVIDKPSFTNEVIVNNNSVHLIPYQHDPIAALKCIRRIPANELIIMHQGLTKSNSGHYIQDKSALVPEALPGLRIISGHYHTRQTIDLPKGGKWDYIGNPFTLNFAEASDPEKGFQILYDDGSLEFVPTNLRKHVKLCVEVDEGGLSDGQGADLVRPGDLVHVDVGGPSELMHNITKERVAQYLGFDSFRVVFQPFEIKTKKTFTKPQSTFELMDTLIDSLTETSPDRKKRLKSMWRDFNG